MTRVRLSRLHATEHQEQATLVLHLQVRHPVMFAHMTAVPHGNLRHKAIAGQLKAEGVSAGYPDLLFDLPRGPFHGLRVEMKRRSRSLSRVDEDQRTWGERLNLSGYLAVVAWGCDHALAQVGAYWALGPFDQTTAVDWSRFELLEPRRHDGSKG